MFDCFVLLLYKEYEPSSESTLDPSSLKITDATTLACCALVYPSAIVSLDCFLRSHKKILWSRVRSGRQTDGSGAGHADPM